MKIFLMLLMIGFAVAGIVGSIMFAYLHESVHQTIFESYGIKSEIRMWPPGTIPETACEENNCILAHNINDAIGRHAIPIYFIIFFSCLFTLAAIESFEDILLNYLKSITYKK